MRILLLDPHGDDWLWCAGTINKYINHGDTVMYVGFSKSEESLPNEFTVHDFTDEILKSLHIIGIKEIKTLDYHVRRFNEYRQNILEDLIKIRDDFKPDIVFAPSTYDVHQDHSVISKECIRAFSKTSSIFGYDMPWNVLNSMINYYSEIDYNDLTKKIYCASIYESQIKKNNNCLTQQFLTSLAVVRGNKVNVEYAEAFEVIILRD